jgi:hypothetical protein
MIESDFPMPLDDYFDALYLNPDDCRIRREFIEKNDLLHEFEGKECIFVMEYAGFRIYALNQTGEEAISSESTDDMEYYQSKSEDVFLDILMLAKSLLHSVSNPESEVPKEVYKSAFEKTMELLRSASNHLIDSQVLLFHKASGILKDTGFGQRIEIKPDSQEEN